jgi:hypothetical protein
MELILKHKEEFLFLAFAISEVLALIPSVKANSIFQIIYFQLKKIKK